ncbi:pilus assembly protein [Streptomyces albus]|nr:pilus assembly protein [Streptomyces albus]
MRGRNRERPARRTDDRGAAILEFAGFLPVLLLIGLAAIQLGLVGYAASQAGSAARAAARVASQEDTGAGAAAGRPPSGPGWTSASAGAAGTGPPRPPPPSRCRPCCRSSVTAGP